MKESLLATGFFKDDVPTQMLSGLGAGFIAVCVGSPVDVVKSRIMSEWGSDKKCVSGVERLEWIGMKGMSDWGRKIARAGLEGTSEKG